MSDRDIVVISLFIVIMIVLKMIIYGLVINIELSLIIGYGMNGVWIMILLELRTSFIHCRIGVIWGRWIVVKRVSYYLNR